LFVCLLFFVVVDPWFLMHSSRSKMKWTQHWPLDDLAEKVEKEEGFFLKNKLINIVHLLGSEISIWEKSFCTFLDPGFSDFKITVWVWLARAETVPKLYPSILRSFLKSLVEHPNPLFKGYKIAWISAFNLSNVPSKN